MLLKGKRRYRPRQCKFLAKRVGMKCEICGYSIINALDVHHVAGWKPEDPEVLMDLAAAWELNRVLKIEPEGAQDVMILCASCHRIVTALEKEHFFFADEMKEVERIKSAYEALTGKVLEEPEVYAFIP